MLTQDKLKKILDYNELSGQFTWIAGPRCGKLAGSLHTSDNYIQISIKKKGYKAHRLAFLYMTGNIPKYVDHINGCRNDNSWDNIREATAQENNRNRKLTTCMTGIKGVTIRKDTGAYQVQIRAKERKIYLGCYYDLDLAELVAREAREHYHKEFARHV